MLVPAADSTLCCLGSASNLPQKRPYPNAAHAAQLIRVVDCYSEPLLFVEASAVRPWQILHANDPALRITGVWHLNKLTHRVRVSERGSCGCALSGIWSASTLLGLRCIFAMVTEVVVASAVSKPVLFYV